MPEERLVALPAGAPGTAPFLALMTTEFITGKGRKGRLPSLYPDVFASPRYGRVFGIVGSDGSPAAALGVRLFRVRRSASIRTGAMIGFVVTRADSRGRGIGRRLMQGVRDHLSEAGIDFGVLWANRADLYLTLGWQPADTSLLGRWRGGTNPSGDVAWTKAPFSTLLRRRLNRMRPASTIERPSLIYNKRPYPADHLWVAAAPGAFALIGETNDTGYAFETGGMVDEAIPLLAAAAERWPDLRVNGSTEDPISRHLHKAGLVAFEANPLAMWISFASRFRKRDAVWIPYLDRI